MSLRGGVPIVEGRSAEQFRMVFEAAPHAILMVGERGEITLVNAQTEQLFGYRRDELLGQSVELLVPDRSRSEHTAQRSHFFHAPSARAMGAGRHLFGLCKDGREVPIEIGLSHILIDQQRYVLASVVDLTERKQAESAMRDKSAVLEAVLESMGDAVLVIDRDGKILVRNRAFSELHETPIHLGEHPDWPRDFGVYLPGTRELCPSDHLPMVRALEGFPTDDAEFEIVNATHPHGVAVSVTGRPLVVSGTVAGGVVVVRNISERKHAEESIRQLNANLENRVTERTAELEAVCKALNEEMAKRAQVNAARIELLRQLNTAEEVERGRISRELHDELGQLVTALIMGLEKIRRSDAVPKHGELQRLIDLAVQISRQAHHVAKKLRPVDLDDLGIQAAVRNYVEEWSEHSGIEADFQTTGFDSDRLALPLETTLYRMIQEALTNVTKHAGARNVSVVLERRKDEVRAIVEDNGRGMVDVESWATDERTVGLGLRGMKERVELLGGRFQIESTLGAGVTLFASIPVIAKV